MREVQRSHLNGLLGMIDPVLGRLSLSGGIYQQARGQVRRRAVGEHLVDVSMPEARRVQLLVLGVADKPGKRPAAGTGRPPGEVGLPC